MSQLLYFQASDKDNNSDLDLWVTDGTTTIPVGNIADINVAGSGTDGLQPEDLTVFGQEVIFAGEDENGGGGLWLTNATPGGGGTTTEIGGVSPGSGHASPFIGGNPDGLDPTDFVAFGDKVIFTGNDVSDFSGLWVTDGTVSGTIELGGVGNAGIPGAEKSGNDSTLSPENITAFNDDVLFDGFDTSGFKGLWISDGTTSGTIEIGGINNQAVADSGTTSFEANDFITLGSMELFNAPNAEGDAALWITDGTAAGTTEIGGINNAGLPGANNTDLGDGLANAVRLGDRVFFSGEDSTSATGLWTTDGTAQGTFEVGGLGDASLVDQEPGPSGLRPTDLTVNGSKVLFEGQDSSSLNELWVSDGTTTGTSEIGGEGAGGYLPHEAQNGLDPYSIVSLGNGEAVFVGYDNSNGQPQGKATLWVTNGTYAGTSEIGGLDNEGVQDIDISGGFSFEDPTDTLVGRNGLAYFVGADTDGDQVLWETNGTLAGTKIVQVTDGNGPNQNQGNPDPNPYLSPPTSSLTIGPAPLTATSFTSGGSINLENEPGEDVSLDPTNANNASYTVTGSNGTVNLIGTSSVSPTASLIGGGLLVNFTGNGNTATLSNTNGNKDSIYGSKGVVTLSDAQVNVFGDKRVTFASGTSGNIVYFYDTNSNGNIDAYAIVGGSDGTIFLESAQVIVDGGGDTVSFLGGTGNVLQVEGTSGAFDTVNGSNGNIVLDDGQANIDSSVGTVSFYTGTTGNVANFVWSGGAANYTISGYVASDTIDLAGLVVGYQTDSPGGTVPENFTLAISGDVVTQTNSDGSRLVTTYDITGHSYSYTAYAYDLGNVLYNISFGGVSGQTYTSYQYIYTNGSLREIVYDITAVAGGSAYLSYDLIYSPGAQLIGQNYFYAFTGGAFTNEEVEVDGAGQTTSIAISGYGGAAFTSYVNAYVDGHFSGTTYTFTNVPTGALYSSYTEGFSASGQFDGADFFLTGLTGAYANEEEDFDGSGRLTRVMLTGITGQPFQSEELDYAAGVYSDYKVFYTNVTGHNYTGEEIEVSSSNQLIKEVFTGVTGADYTSYEEDFSGGVLTQAIYDTTYVSGSGSSFYAYQLIENGSGTALQETYDLDSGAHEEVALATGQTLTSQSEDAMYADGHTNTTFLLDPLYGSVTVADFSAANHDIISFSSSEFSSVAAILSASQTSGGNTIITAVDHDTVTLTGVTAASLVAGDFTLHP